MKYFVTLLFYCLSLTALLSQTARPPQAELLSSSGDEIIVRFTLPGFDQQTVATPNGPALVITFPESSPLLEAGAPDLPKYAAVLRIPLTGAMTAEVIDADFVDLPNVDVAPSKGNLPRTIDPRTAPYTYGPAYQTDAFFPARPVGLQQPFMLRGARGQSVWFQPIAYNPTSRMLRVYSEITVRIRPSGETGENEASRTALKSASPAFEQLYAKTFLNYEPAAGDRSGSASAMEKMLVITPQAYLPLLEPLLAWKRQLGIYTLVTTTEELGASDATTVFDYVNSTYQSEEITYVLLVGDENAVGTKMINNLSCDNCFGFLEGTDHLAEVFVGRLNAADAAQLAIMVNRQLEYEKTPFIDTTANWVATGLALTSNQGPGDDNQMDFEQGNEWKSKHLADGFEKYYEFYDGSQAAVSPTPGDASADQSGDPSATAVVDLMNNRGVTIFNYTGHGWAQGFSSGNFSTSAAAQLRNHHRYPIVIGVACCVGDFTNTGGDCLGDALQRAGDPATGEAWGAISSFMSSITQSWSPPMEGQDGMNQYLADADGVALCPSIGSMGAYGMAAMVAAYGSAGNEMVDYWNHFGEPSTVPRTRLPQSLVATAPDTVAVGSTTLTVESPVEGALVGLYWQGQTLAAARVENGVATLEFPALNTVGDLTITVSQFNHLPIQQTIPVTVQAGPFVVNQSLTFSDPAGDLDLQADYGETLLADLTLANVGLENALDVTASLSTSDPYISLTDADEAFGNLPPSGMLLKPGAFSFTVADNVPDQHLVSFQLLLTFNSNQTLVVPATLKVQAPQLGVTTFSVDDTQSGNGNGRLESGETAIVRVGNINTGKSASPTAIGTLSSASPWLSIGAAANLGALAAETGAAEAAFSVTVAADAPTAVAAGFEYLVAAGNYSATASFGPVPINPIVESFESSNFNTFTWTMGGNTPWTITPLQPYSGAYCSRSGFISNSQSSKMTLALNVTAAGNISFARRVSSEANYDFLRFLIDGVEVAAWSGELPWEEVSFPVDPGLHTFTWSYEKDNLIAEGQDRGWVDEILLPPNTIVVNTSEAPAGLRQLSAAPNPTSGRVLVYGHNLSETPRTIRIFDAQARLVQQQTATRTAPGAPWAQELDLGALPNGLYFIEIVLEKSTETIRVIKN